MAITVGPSLATGPIRWSTLREEFLAKQPRTSYSGSDTIDNDLNSGSISAKQLLRDTDTTHENPVVPDCKENRDAGISDSTNLKASQFRNSIKFYYAQQTGTNDNSSNTSQPGLEIDVQGWNTNLGDTVVKKIFIDGTVGSTVISQPALKLSNVTTNLEVVISGNVYAAGGLGGATAGNSVSYGQNGGNAIQIDSPNNSNVVINLVSGSKVYAGGGGGERGNKGADGGGGTCRMKSSSTGCGNYPGCPDHTWSSYSTSSGGCCKRKCACWFCWCSRCKKRYKTRKCQKDYSIGGGGGGAGGAGGTGRGYNNLSGSIAGSGGVGGSGGGSCGGNTTVSNSSSGKTGGTGAAAGDWNGVGSIVNSSTAPSIPGKAIIGSSFKVKGSAAASIKGAYKPS